MGDVSISNKTPVIAENAASLVALALFVRQVCVLAQANKPLVLAVAPISKPTTNTVAHAAKDAHPPSLAKKANASCVALLPPKPATALVSIPKPTANTAEIAGMPVQARNNAKMVAAFAAKGAQTAEMGAASIHSITPNTVGLATTLALEARSAIKASVSVILTDARLSSKASAQTEKMMAGGLQIS